MYQILEHNLQNLCNLVSYTHLTLQPSFSVLNRSLIKLFTSSSCSSFPFLLQPLLYIMVFYSCKTNAPKFIICVACPWWINQIFLGWQPRQVVRITRCFRNQLYLLHHSCNMAQHPSYWNYMLTFQCHGKTHDRTPVSTVTGFLALIPTGSLFCKSVMGHHVQHNIKPTSLVSSQKAVTYLLFLYQAMHVACYLIQTVHMQYMLEAWGLS